MESWLSVVGHTSFYAKMVLAKFQSWRRRVYQLQVPHLFSWHFTLFITGEPSINQLPVLYIEGKPSIHLSTNYCGHFK